MGKVIKGLISPISLAPKAVQAAALVAIGVATGNPQLVVMGISIGLSKVSAMLGPKTPKSQFSRLTVSLDPSTPRKAVLGTTAMNLDLRYHEVSGTDQEFADYIIALAAHEVNSIDEIWFDDKQAWTSGGGVTATYSGYLTVTPREVGTSGNTISINGGAKWGSSRRLTGCAYLHLRIRRTGVSKKTESPLVNGLPTRVTVIGDGALLYDPRRDSTVAGGSGLHRVNDQATWGNYTAADDTDNPALQLLWFLLGWRINGELSIGCGIPASRIDIPSFIAAANVCDENVTLAIGGTQKRYRTSGTFSDADDRMELIQSLLSCMNGTLRDSNGKLAVEVLKNDLADYVIDFDDHDIIGDFEWQQTGGLDQVYNVARGRYVDPSNNSLYQTVEYPEVSVASLDGIERELSLDLPFVEDGRRAQRLAKQILQRSQYQGRFTATFKAKALGCSIGEVVRLSFEPLGWSNKLFRVVEQEVRFDGLVPLVLLEENAAIYAWDSEDSAPITPTAPTVYDPLNSPFILGAEEAAQSATWANITGTGGQPTGATVAGAVTTGGLIAPNAVVSTRSLVPDPDFQTGAAGWAGFVDRLPRADAAVPAGCPTPFAARFNARDNAYAQYLPVREGEVYKISGWVNRGTGSGGAGIGFYGATRTAAGVRSGFVFSGASTTASGWVFLSVAWQVPAGAISLEFGPWADRAAYTGEAWYTEFNIERVVDSSLIGTDAVVANNIAANAVEANSIAALAVDTPKIAGNAVTVGVSAYSDGDIIVPSGSGSTIIQSVVITTSGRPVSLFTQAHLFGHSGFAFAVPLLARNGTVLREGPGRFIDEFTPADSIILHVDTPPAGTHTYELVAAQYVSNPQTAQKRFLFALETKK